MPFDDIISQIGEFGRYQQRIYFLLCLPVIICAFHQIGTSFLGLNVSFRCILPAETAKNTTYQMPTYLMDTIYVVKNKSGFVQACEIRQNVINKENNQASNDSTKTSPGSQTCKKIIYDKSVYESTTTTEWDLVCDRKWLKTVGDSLFMVGVMIGGIFFGSSSDRFGRRPTLLFALLIQLLGGLLVSIAPNYIFYVIARMIVGSACNGILVITFVMAVELVGPTKRGFVGLCYQFFWTAGYIGVAGVSYIFPSWRKLQLAISLPSFFFILYWWLIPESVRWMISNRKIVESKDQIQRISKGNGKEITLDTLDGLLKEYSDDSQSSAPEETSIFELIRYSSLRRKVIFLSTNWFVICATYYGLSWNAVALSDNIYMNHLISGLVEIPSTIFLIWSLDRWGRKLILCCSFLMVGAALVSIAFLPEGHFVANVALYMIGKAAVSLCFSVIFVFTVEQIPTVVRNAGLGTCITCGKIGAITAPFVNNLSDIWLPLPMITFGMMAFFCGAITTLLPETLGEKFPETMKERELNTELICKKRTKMEIVAKKTDSEPLSDVKNCE